MEIDVDFAKAESFDERMPERTKWLRENEPVYWSEKTGCYIITRFDDVVHVSKNNDVFCSGEGVLPGRIDTKIGMIDEDEPRHGEMRSLINRGFTPRMVKKWEEALPGRSPTRRSMTIAERRASATSSRTSQCRCRSS